MVVIIDKEADIVSVTSATLSNYTAKPQGCRKLASRHDPSVNSLFPVRANVLRFRLFYNYLVKISYANTFLASGSESSMPLPLQRTW